MGRIIEIEQPYNFDEIVATKGANYHPDFRVLTAGIESVNDHTVHMIGSSTEKDLQGDTMSLKALNSMTKAAPNLTIWLNHDYTLPDSMFGSIIGTPAIKHADGIADLHLNVDVELSNQAAAKVKRYIDNGRRLGCSIGCMVTKYEISEDGDAETWNQPIVIHDVYVVEYSVVGIPANQRSWVENAIRGVFQRTLDPQLAPAMKNLWPSMFQQTVKNATHLSTTHLKALQEAPVRQKENGRIHWIPEKKTFSLTWKDKTREVSHKELGDFFADRTPLDMIDATPVASLKEVDEIETDMLLEEKDTNPDMDKMFAINKDGTDGLEIKDEKGNHAKYTGTHSHHHDSFGHGDVADHAHEHFHNNDNGHSHDHAHTGMGDTPYQYGTEPEKTAATDAATESKAAEVGTEVTVVGDKELALVETPATFEEIKSATPLQELVALTDTMLPVLASYNMLGKSLGLPEITPELAAKGQHPVTTKALDAVVLQQCQTMHDALSNMTGGAVCANSQSLQEIETQATEENGGDVSGQMNVLNSFGTHIQHLTKAFENMDIASLKKDAETTRTGMSEARKQLDSLNEKIEEAIQTLSKIKNMPLGNPVNHTRTVQESDATVTREELLKAGALPSDASHANIFAQTEVKSVGLNNSMTMTYRYWPAGVGSVEKGTRPALTSNQIQFMDYDDVKAYRDGGEAKVPHIENQVR